MGTKYKQSVNYFVLCCPFLSFSFFFSPPPYYCPTPSPLPFFSLPSEIEGGNLVHNSHTVLFSVGPQLDGTESETFEVMQGESILLPCEVSGTPRPVVQWRQNFSPFTPRSPRFQFQDSGLYVQEARVEDKAIYECIASNVAGNVTKVITLIVYSELLVIIPATPGKQQQ